MLRRKTQGRKSNFGVSVKKIDLLFNFQKEPLVFIRFDLYYFWLPEKLTNFLIYSKTKIRRNPSKFLNIFLVSLDVLWRKDKEEKFFLVLLSQNDTQFRKFYRNENFLGKKLQIDCNVLIISVLNLWIANNMVNESIFG